MKTIRNLVIAGLALLVLEGGIAGCARHKQYLLLENHPAAQTVNCNHEQFNFYKAREIIIKNPEAYGDYLESCRRTDEN